MRNKFPLNKFHDIKTPFYYYDTKLLHRTLDTIKAEIGKYNNFHLHYAVKANSNPTILNIISQYGFGADCVSGGEIKAAINSGFSTSHIVYAGVGKSDWEINLGLDNDIFCFNVESTSELEIINEIASAHNKVANVAFRVNPDIGAHTHANITTGLAENKFGISMHDLDMVMAKANEMKNISVIGLHFHIGSQITDMTDFEALCNRVNDIQEKLERKNIVLPNINVGGGLGINYEYPDKEPLPDFKHYFETYDKHLKLRPGQHLHFELGRAVVAQCGTLITRMLYVKEGTHKKFAIVDAGMTDLIRPALYHAYHKIENLSSCLPEESYDVVGPICESSDVFAKDILLNKCYRGDIIAIRSAGAYGEVMASQYNCRELPKGYTTEELCLLIQ